MAVTNTPIFPQTFQAIGTTFVNADSTNKKTIFTAGLNGSKVEAVYITSTDTSAQATLFYLSDGSTDFQISYQGLAANQGNGSLAPGPINLFQNVFGGLNLGSVMTLDVNGNGYLYIPFGWSMKGSITSSVTSGKTITITVLGEDF